MKLSNIFLQIDKWGHNHFHDNLRLWDSPQVKQCTVITYKHGIYELPQKWPNDLRLRILWNYKISGKCLNFIEWYPSGQSNCQNEHFVNSSKNGLKKKRNYTFPVVHYFTWKVELASNILWMIVAPTGKVYYIRKAILLWMINRKLKDSTRAICGKKWENNFEPKIRTHGIM